MAMLDWFQRTLDGNEGAKAAPVAAPAIVPAPAPATTSPTAASIQQRRWARIRELARICPINEATPLPRDAAPGTPAYQPIVMLAGCLHWLHALGCTIEDNGQGGLKIGRPDELVSEQSWQEARREYLPAYRDQFIWLLSTLATEEMATKGRR